MPVSEPFHDHLDILEIMKAAKNFGFETESFELAKSLIHTITDLTKEANWTRMAMSTAQGSAPIDYAYLDATFDGRYIYFAPKNSDTFVRFDTQGTFTNASDWQQMSISTAQGAAPGTNPPYTGTTFDGRYVYFVPYRSDTFVRFDTQGTFTTESDWQRMSMSTAQGGAALDHAYIGASFDGRYIYFVPYSANTFVRFDTQGTFTNSSDWQQMSMSTAQGGATGDEAYYGASFDGRYVYFVPEYAGSFVRFDTQGTFTNASDWQQMSKTTVQGGVASGSYKYTTFDGRYIYFVPKNSATFVRFDTQGTFTNVLDWQQMSMSTVQGSVALNEAYLGATFDGRYVYFVPDNSDTFVRFDTQGAFTNLSDWQIMSMSTAQGSAALDHAYAGAAFDGRYIYFVPFHSDTFVRFAGMQTKGWVGRSEHKVTSGSFVVSGDGAIAVSGLNFKPKKVSFLVTYATGTQTAIVFGVGSMVDDGTQRVICWAHQTGVDGDIRSFSGNSNCFALSDGDGTIRFRATYTSMDNDGFTVTIANYASGGTVYWEATN